MSKRVNRKRKEAGRRRRRRDEPVPAIAVNLQWIAGDLVRATLAYDGEKCDHGHTVTTCAANAVARYLQQVGTDPVAEIIGRLRATFDASDVNRDDVRRWYYDAEDVDDEQACSWFCEMIDHGILECCATVPSFVVDVGAIL